MKLLELEQAIKDGRCKIVHAYPKVFGKLILRVKEIDNGFQIDVYDKPVSPETYKGTLKIKHNGRN